MSREISNQISTFARENEDYEVVVKEYMNYSEDELSDDKDLYYQLNLDIISGNIPDIMIFNSDMPIEHYISKGILSDLTPFFQNEDELVLDNYMANIFSCFNSELGLYVIPSEFYLTGYVCSKELVPDININLSEIETIKNSKQIQNRHMFGLNTREQILINYLAHNCRKLIDYDNCTCLLNSKEFIEMMCFIKQFPVKFDNNDIAIENYYDMWRKHQAMFLNYSIGSFQDYAVAEQVYFGEGIRILGFPGSEQKEPSIATDFLFAISNNSECKDVAWNFVSRFLKPEYQNSLRNTFPVAKESLYRLCDNSQGTDIEGNTFYYGAENEQILIGLGKEVALELVHLIERLDNRVVWNRDVFQIVIDEATYFFAGERDIETVIANMENRLSIYLNE